MKNLKIPLLLAVLTIIAMKIVSPFHRMASLTLISVLLSGVFLYLAGMLIVKRKVSGTAAIYQIFLFYLLHMQVYGALGAHHYTFKEAPGWFDWLKFVGAHVLRAGDILDFLEEYHIQIQDICHNSNLSAGLVVAMHWMVDVFLLAFLFQKGKWENSISLADRLHKKVLLVFVISLVLSFLPPVLIIAVLSFITLVVIWLFKLIRMVLRLWQKWSRFVKGALRTFILLFLTLYLWTAHKQGWPWVEILWWWPLDNFIRVVDIGDSLQIFNIVLYHVPASNWNIDLALFFRFLLSLSVVDIIARVHLLYFGGVGISVKGLVENLTSEDEQVRQAAAKELAETEEVTTDLVFALADENEKVQKTVMEVLDQVNPQWQKTSQARKAMDYLLKKLVTPGRFKMYASALEIVDPNWRASDEAHAATSFFLKQLADKRMYVREAAADSFGSRAKIAVPALRKCLKDRFRSVRRAAAEALGRIKAKNAIFDLLKVTLDEYSLARQAAKQALDSIDPMWRKSPQAVRMIPSLIQTLAAKSWKRFFSAKSFSLDKRLAAAQMLGELGEEAKNAITELIKASLDPDRQLAKDASQALEKIDPQWAKSIQARQAEPAIRKALNHRNPAIEQAATRMIEKIRKGREGPV